MKDLFQLVMTTITGRYFFQKKLDFSKVEFSYKHKGSEYPWIEAKDYCKSNHGSHLVSIFSENQEKLFTQLLAEKDCSSTWIGLNDWEKNSEGEFTFKWEATNEEPYYTNWGPNEPDPNMQPGSRCAIIKKGETTWVRAF